MRIERTELGRVEAASAARRAGMIRAQGKLGPGERLSDLIGHEMVYAYRWIPGYADEFIRPGDYVLLDPDEGRHYGGRNAKRLTIRVSAELLEYRQGDEYIFVGERAKKAYASR